ncbi:hypothetical protein KY311_00640, partial [Candidatus Woesearchaeota archaeon]|nr:hypothetical protein [Candidatus Woesearchaeota archaeon]
DLFNTSLPSIDSLKLAVTEFKKLKDSGIPLYIIEGSHDFSPSGKTMIDVLEQAGLVVNVARADDSDSDKLKLKFIVDKKTGAKLCGMIGKKGGLEKSFFEDLDHKHLEAEKGFKIFVFHTALDELKPKELKDMDSAPISMLPKGFNYYASGHVHIRKTKEIAGHGLVVYPGPVFPNSFSELEKVSGGFYIYDNGNLLLKELDIIKTMPVELDCSNKTPEQATSEVVKILENKKLQDTIVLLRLFGTLGSGKVSDIDFREIMNAASQSNAYFLMKNTNKLATKDYEEIKVSTSNIEEIETQLIKENIGQIDITKEEDKLVKQLMLALDAEKHEGELNRDFEARLNKGLNRIFGLD